MATYLRVSLDSIIKNKNLTVYFQSIVANKNTAIFAYEALIRGPINSPLYFLIALFKEARKRGRAVE